MVTTMATVMMIIHGVNPPQILGSKSPHMGHGSNFKRCLHKLHAKNIGAEPLLAVMMMMMMEIQETRAASTRLLHVCEQLKTVVIFCTFMMSCGSGRSTAD